MTRRLLLTYLGLTAAVLLVLEIPLGISFARSEREALTADVERDATVLVTFVEDELERGLPMEMPSLGEQYRRRTGGRVLIVDRKGTVVADTDPVAGSKDYSSRPEVASALRGHRATGVRHSATLGTDLLYVAVPVASGGNVYGALRITYPMSAVNRRVRRNWLLLGLVAVVVLSMAALVGTQLARWVDRPVRTLRRATSALAAGDLSVRADASAGPPEMRDLAHTFNDMAGRLEDLVDAQRTFVADASHQLRSPLTALRLRLENVEDGLGPEAREDVEAAVAETSRLSSLVDGLLALARAEGARVERGVVDVAGVVHERAAAWRPLAEERRVVLGEDAEAVRALALPGALEQILDNLLANALEVAPAGSKVTVTVGRRGDWVEVHVTDAGPGMTDDERTHAFDRFWRSPDRGGEGGSGLGLAIVHGLVVAGGGEVSLEPAPGGGLDARVRLRAV